MKKYFTIVFLWSICCNSQHKVNYSQDNNAFAYGFSAKAILDLARNESSSFRISFAAGAGYSIYPTNLTSVNLEFSYVTGGLGTYKNENMCYWVVAPLLTQSLVSKAETLDAPINRNQPLYYFSDLVAPPLQNPFQNALSIGLNWINFLGPHHTERWQRVAHAGVKLNKVHVAYNNDGGPILKWWGDRRDRYFTGIGFANVHLDDNLIVNHYGISFYKFTGYTEMAFELSDELLYASVDYKDPNQNFFNFGFWNFSMGNTTFGDVSLRYNNPPDMRETQNLIHYVKGYGYHQNLGEKYFSLAFSPSYGQTYTPTK